MTGGVFSGGISGTNSGLIQECRSTFTINLLNISDGYNQHFFIGGLAGSNESSYISAKIDQSYSEMHINKFWFASTLAYLYKGMNNAYVGGIVGNAANTDIKDCHGLLHIGKKSETSTKTAEKFYWAGLTSSTMWPLGIMGPIMDNGTSISNSYMVLKADTDISDDMWLSGIVYSTTAKAKLSNVYFDKDVMAENYTKTIEAVTADSSVSYNVLGKTTKVMQSPAFVETLNTNAGLDDDSGMWQYCEGHYPILVSEGTCKEFYSKYGLSSSSSAESSSSTSVESSSSKAESSSSKIEFSSSSGVSSSSAVESSSSNAMSSSSENASSSSLLVSSSSSKTNSSSSDGTPIIWKTVQPSFHLAVEGMTVTLSNTQRGVVRIFDALGHLVASKTLAGSTTSITLQTPGNYIVRVNGISRMATLK